MIMLCSIESCINHTRHNGLCNKHYLQIRRHGRIFVSRRDKRPAIIEGTTAKIPLGVDAKDGYALVNSEFAYLAEDNWRKTHWGYAIRSRDKKLLHRVIVNAPRGKVIDHINGDPLDNRLSNTRVCTQAENSRNQKIKRTNTSGYKGVKRMRNRFQAVIKTDYVSKVVGTFDTPEEAAVAYDQAALKYHGEFARLNHG